MYFLEFHICFKNAKFLFINYMHTCLLIILFFYDIWSLKVCKTTKMYLLKGSPNAPPTAHFSFTAPLELLTTPRRAVPQLGTTALND